MILVLNKHFKVYQMGAPLTESNNTVLDSWLDFMQQFSAVFDDSSRIPIADQDIYKLWIAGCQYGNI